MHAARAQCGNIGLRGGMRPHFRVHGRGKKHRTTGHQQRGGQQIVGVSASGLRQKIGGGRGHHDQIGLMADPHVVDLIHGVKNIVGDGSPAQGLPGCDAHKIRGCVGGNDRDLVAGLGEEAQQ